MGIATSSAGSNINDKLANSNFLWWYTAGGTDATSNITYPTSSLSGTITNASLTGSIANDEISKFYSFLWW